jgi:hypothetical protein
VDWDEILCVGDGIEHCLLWAYVGKVGLLILPSTSCCGFHVKKIQLRIYLQAYLCSKIVCPLTRVLSFFYFIHCNVHFSLFQLDIYQYYL